MKHLFRTLKLNILLPVVAITVFVVVLLTVLVSHTYTDRMLQQQDEKNATALTYAGNMIDSAVAEARQATLSVMTESAVTRYATRNYHSNSEMVHARRDCLDTMNTAISRLNVAYGMLFMREDGSVFGSLPYRNYFLEQQKNFFMDEEEWSRVTPLSNGEIAWFGPYEGSALYEIRDNPKYEARIFLGIQKQRYEYIREGYSVLAINAESFQDYLNLLADSDSTLRLFTRDGVEMLRMGNDSTVPFQDLLSAEGESRILHEDSSSLYIRTVFLPNVGWYLVRETRMDAMYRAVRQLQGTVWLFAFAVFAVALVFYARWLNSFLKTFNTLKSGMIRLGEGHLDTRLEQPFHIEEFESMRQEFNRMNDSLNRYMVTTREMERNQLELEMRNLQTTLSPHMVFNSITAIRWMASMLGAEKVADMLSELSQMLWPVLREWRIQWTVREEMDHLQHYAKLLDLRYGNNFRMETELEEEVLEALIPRFTLQPLVENACEHGGHPQKAMLVRIDARREEEWIHMTVHNNGRDITEEELSKIRQILLSGNRGKNIGLYNVYSRLAICMGKESTLDVSCPPEGGTLVTIRWKIRYAARN